MRLSVHTVRLSFTTLAGHVHSGVFQTLDQTTYFFKLIKMVAHSKVALLINQFAATAAAEHYKHPCNIYRIYDIQIYHA